MARSTRLSARRTQPGPPAVLDRLPAWATTGVGSLPHTFPEHAAAHVVGEYDVPFCPQLPRLEGDIVGARRRRAARRDRGPAGRRSGRARSPRATHVSPLDRRAARVLARHLARGGRVAWGVLAAHRPERAAHAAWRLSAALARLGASPAAVGPSSLLTASCGTGSLSPRREAEVTAALAYMASSA